MKQGKGEGKGKGKVKRFIALEKIEVLFKDSRKRE
jgi:hypothetical protein